MNIAKESKTERDVLKKQSSFFEDSIRINHGSIVLYPALTNQGLLLAMGLEHRAIHWNDELSVDEILQMLHQGLEYLKKSHPTGASELKILSQDEVNQNRALSHRQVSRNDAVLDLVLEKKYTEALHELQDCIINYQRDTNIIMSVNEYAIYTNLFTMFISQLQNTLSQDKELSL